MRKIDSGMYQMPTVDVTVSGQMKKPINCAAIEPMSKTYLTVRLGSSADRDSMPGMFTAHKSTRDDKSRGGIDLQRIDGTKHKQLVSIAP